MNTKSALTFVILLLTTMAILDYEPSNHRGNGLGLYGSNQPIPWTANIARVKPDIQRIERMAILTQLGITPPDQPDPDDSAWCAFNQFPACSNQN